MKVKCTEICHTEKLHEVWLFKSLRNERHFLFSEGKLDLYSGNQIAIVGASLLIAISEM